MIKELVKDEAILSTPCEPAAAADAEIAQDLVDTLLSIEDAACLAANQIGVTKAICALADDEGNTLVMYNPKVLFGMGAFKAEESCLTREGDSFRQDQGRIRRAGRRRAQAAQARLCRVARRAHSAHVRPLPGQADLSCPTGKSFHMDIPGLGCCPALRFALCPDLPCAAFCPCSDLLCSSYLKTRTIRPIAVLDGPGFYV